MSHRPGYSPRVLSAALVITVALTSGACATGGTSPSPAASGSDAITATLSEWSIDLSTVSAPSGRVTLSITNSSTTVHEFLVIRTDMMAGSLPLRDHRIDVDAMGGPMGSGMDMPGMSPASDMEHPSGTVGSVEDIAAGATTELVLDNLEAGHYVVVCDIETHYEQGMWADLTVG